jgi:predicted dehydrogenase
MQKILIVSLGSIGQRHLQNTRDLLPHATIGVLRQHFKTGHIPPGVAYNFSNIDEALAFKPDAVIIASPATQHLELADQFAKAGAHLFIEKPLAETTKNNENFFKDLVAAKPFVMLGYVLRFLPLLHEIRDIVKTGKLGVVWTARVEVGQYLPDWRPNSDYRKGVSAQKALGGGALLELSHEIDYTTWLFGFPQRLFCSASKLSSLEIDVEDSAQLIFEYSDKKISIQLDFLQRVPHMEIEIVGSNGSLRANLVQETASVFSAENPQGKPLNNVKSKNGNEVYLRQFDLFFSKAFKDYRPRYKETAGFTEWSTVEHASKVLHIVELAKESSEKGVRLSL